MRRCRRHTSRAGRVGGGGCWSGGRRLRSRRTVQRAVEAAPARAPAFSRRPTAGGIQIIFAGAGGGETETRRLAPRGGAGEPAESESSKSAAVGFERAVVGGARGGQGSVRAGKVRSRFSTHEIPPGLDPCPPDAADARGPWSIQSWTIWPSSVIR